MAKSLFWRDIAFPSDQPVTFDNQLGIEVPKGSTAQRPSDPEEGVVRFNTTIGGLEIFQDNSWETISVTSITGESNTGSNIGGGVGLFKEKTGTDLVFKTIVAGSNISLTNGTNTITIDASSVGETNTASNIGTGTGTVFSSKVGSDLRLRSIKSNSAYITVTNNTSTIDIDTSLTPGEINTVANLGGGEGLYSGKVATELQLKSIVANSPLTITSTSSTVDIGLENNASFPGTGSIKVPTGTTAQRPGSPVNGMIRYNSSNSKMEAYINGSWTDLAGEGNGVLKTGDTMSGTLIMGTGANVDLTQGNLTLTQGNLSITSGNAVLSSGNLTLSSGNIVVSGTVDGRDVSADGAIVDQLTGITNNTGFITKSGGSLLTRTISANASNNRLGISLSGGDGSANVSIGLDITGRTEVSTLANDDELLIYDTSVTTNRKMTVQSLGNHLNANSLMLDTVSSLTALNTSSARYTNVNTVILKGHTTISDNGGGVFYYDSSDTTTAANSCTVIVDASGKRWKRANVTELTTDMIGCLGDGITLADHTKFINLLNIAAALRVPVVIPGNREIVLRGLVTPPSNTYIKGPGRINFISGQRGGTFYNNTAAGLAGTTLGNNFRILSLDGNSYSLYKHEAGPVATLLATYPYLPGGISSACFTFGNIFPATGIVGRPSNTSLKTGPNSTSSTIVFNYPTTVPTRRIYYRIQLFHNSGSTRTCTLKRMELVGGNFVKVSGSIDRTIAIPTGSMPRTIEIPYGFNVYENEYLGIHFEAAGVVRIAVPDPEVDDLDVVEYYSEADNVDTVPATPLRTAQYQIKMYWLDANQNYENITFDGITIKSVIENEFINFFNFQCQGGNIDNVTVKNCRFIYAPIDGNGNFLPDTQWPSPAGDRWAVVFGGYSKDLRSNITYENNTMIGPMQLTSAGGRADYTNISIVRNKVFGGKQNPIAMSRTGSASEIAVWKRIHMSYNEIIAQHSLAVFLGVDSQSLYTAPIQISDCAITHNVIHSDTTTGFPTGILFRAAEGPDSFVKNMVISHNKISMVAGSSAIEYLSATGTDPFDQAPINEGEISNNVCIGPGSAIRILTGTKIKANNNSTDNSIFIGSGAGTVDLELIGNRANNLRMGGSLTLYSNNNSFFATDGSFCMDLDSATGKTAVIKSVNDTFTHRGSTNALYAIRIRGTGTNTIRVIHPIDAHNAWTNGFFSLENSNTLTEYVNGPNDDRVTTRGDVSITLTVGTNKANQLFNTTLTADRTVTLSTNGANTSSMFCITRSGGGAFNLTVGGGLIVLAQNEWCVVRYNGSSWYVAQAGTTT